MCIYTLLSIRLRKRNIKYSILGSGVQIDRKITIYTDGAARGNPGPSASGFMAYEGKRMVKAHAEYNGNSTNNYSEYKAVSLALGWCASNMDAAECTVELYSDSELMIRQLNGAYKVKSQALKPLNEQINRIVGKFRLVKFGNVRRENIYIKAVDRSLNVLLDERDS
jgi:ribonuclease HI